MSVTIKSRKDKITRIIKNENGPDQAVLITESKDKDGKVKKTERLVRMFEPDPVLMGYLSDLGFETGTDQLNNVEAVHDDGGIRYRGHAGSAFRQWCLGLSAGISLYVASTAKKQTAALTEAFLSELAEARKSQRGPTKADMAEEIESLRKQLAAAKK